MKISPFVPGPVSHAGLLIRCIIAIQRGQPFAIGRRNQITVGVVGAVEHPAQHVLNARKVTVQIKGVRGLVAQGIDLAEFPTDIVDDIGGGVGRGIGGGDEKSVGVIRET